MSCSATCWICTAVACCIHAHASIWWIKSTPYTHAPTHAISPPWLHARHLPHHTHLLHLVGPLTFPHLFPLSFVTGTYWGRMFRMWQCFIWNGHNMEPNLVHSCNHMPIPICLSCLYVPAIYMYAYAHAQKPHDAPPCTMCPHGMI